jgi:hypothetical protein
MGSHGQPQEDGTQLLGEVHNSIVSAAQVETAVLAYLVDVDSTESARVPTGVGTSIVEEEFVSCTYCTRKWMKALCVPVGDRSTAKRWKDKACQAAQKFVERVAEGQGVHAVEQLSFRRTQRPSLYAKDICRVRINAPDDPEPEMDEFRSLTICTTSISGDVSGAYSQRREIAAEYAEMWENFRSVQFEDVVAYMNKRQFVQYFKLFEGHTQVESEELWAEALQNKSVLSRKDIKGNDTCPVRLPSVLRQMVGVSHKKQYRTTETVEEGDESNQRQKVAALATAAQDESLHEMGMPFQASAAVSATEMDKPKVAKSRNSAGHLGNLVGHGIDAVSDGVSTQSSRSSGCSQRGQAASASVPEVSAESLSDQIGAGADLSLTQSRVAANALCTKFLKAADGPKASTVKMLRELIGKMDDDHAEVVALNVTVLLEQLKSYTILARKTKETNKNWTKASSRDHLKGVLEALVQGDRIVVELTEAFSQLKSVYALELNENGKERRNQGIWLARVLKDIKQNKDSWPQPLTRWLGITTFKMTLEDESWKPVDSPKLVDRCAQADISVDLMMTSPLVFHEGSTNAFHVSAQKIFEAFKGRVKKQAEKVLAAASFKNYIVVRPAGEPHDLVHEQDWVPAPLVAKGGCQQLDTIGYSWLLSGNRLSFYQGIGNIPYCMFPMFIWCVQGSFLCSAWNVDAETTAGGKVGEFVGLASQMKPKDADKFFKDHADTVVLKATLL